LIQRFLLEIAMPGGEGADERKAAKAAAAKPKAVKKAAPKPAAKPKAVEVSLW
jgi:hypothetical protein